MIKAEIDSSATLPFERNYYLRAEKENVLDTDGSGGTKICWFVQREKMDVLEERGIPDYLEIKEDKILFLRQMKDYYFLLIIQAKPGGHVYGLYDTTAVLLLIWFYYTREM